MKSSTLVIAIAGGSGSGKTTIAKALQARIGDQCVQVLSQDRYYLDQSAKFTGDGEGVNFDHPESLDFNLLTEHLTLLRRGQTVQVPTYEFKTHRRLPSTEMFSPAPIIVVDGTLILFHGAVRLECDHRFFVSAPEDLRYERRVSRDVKERGRTREGVRLQFERQVKPMHDLFVEPSSENAEVILDGAGSIQTAVDRVIAQIHWPLT